MKKIFFIFFLFGVTQFYAQSTSFKVAGIILSKKEKKPLESATVHIEKIKDSTITTYTITNSNGHFSLAGKSFEKEVKLYVSFIGYQSFSKKLILSNNNPINLGVIYLEENNTLDEVIITSRAPITIKKDTLEFNVKSFKTKKDANVEDLLKKLPGVEVDEEGQITVNGKPVNRILVNGKPFFGNDPTITTRNLNKDIIEKVQITNTKTKAEAFTGQKGDDDNQTINLTIRKENNKGWFGRVAGGTGTDKRYEFASMVNRFDNDTRVSVLLGGNNTNSPGFSFGEIEKMFGGLNSASFNSNGSFSFNGMNFGGGNGITTSNNTGLTYADKLGKKTEINTNYFYSSADSENKTIRNRENILPDSRYFSETENISFSGNKNHSIALEIDIEIDSTFLININPNFVFNRRESNSTLFEESFDENYILTNTSNNSFSSNSSANNFGNDIGFTKKIGNRGSFLELSFYNQIDKTELERFQLSTTEVINGNTEIRNQKSDETIALNQVFTKLTYRYALIDSKLFLDLSYKYDNNNRTNINNTYDFDNNTQKYSIFNNLLSSDFSYKDLSKTPEASISYVDKKWRMSFKTGYVFRTLESNDKLRPLLNLKRNFEALELATRFRYRFSQRTATYLGYTLLNSAPSLRQLQAFEDVSNPLNIIVGNPNLQPTNNHRLYAGYHQFNFQKGIGVFGFTNFRYSTNNVISKSFVDPITLKRTTTYENVTGDYSLNTRGNIRKTIKLDSVRTIKLRTGLSININRNINFFNEQQYSSKTTSFSPNIGFTFTWKDLLEIEPRYTVSLSNTRYDLSNFDTQKFTSHSLRIRTKTTVPKKLEWQNDVRFSYNPNVVAGFQRSAWFWNTTLAYSVFKNQGVLSLKAYDLLNQNNNSRRIANANFIEDSESTVLQQYFMLSFSWKFNTLGKKGEIKERRRFRRH